MPPVDIRASAGSKASRRYGSGDLASTGEQRALQGLVYRWENGQHQAAINLEPQQKVHAQGRCAL